MSDWLRDVFRDRPFWLNAVMVFCAYMTFVYMPWDLFVKPAAVDAEVWFGVMFTGVWAKVMGIPHWIVYAGALYGIRRRRPWMAVGGALYSGQVAFGMFLWPILQYGGVLGLFMGAIAAVPFSLLAMAFWNARDYFAHDERTLRERYGDWALVTGASAGLGVEFARALARDGVNVVLTARREDRLEALAAELKRQYGIEARTIRADLSETYGADQLADALKDIEIGILVNNAGFGYAGRFEKLDVMRLREMVEVNCVAPMVLTRRILPGMRTRGRGAVIITGSVAGRQPLPLHGVYSATKAFDLFLGESLFIETRETGIDVLVVEPGSTATEFQNVAGEIAHEGASPAEVVAEAFAALGQQPSVITGWFNYLRANFATRVGSRPLVAYVAGQVVREQTPEDMR